MSINNPQRPSAMKTELITFDINPPTLNTLHEVFHITTGGVLHNLFVIQTNTPTNAEEIDVLITIDGRTILYDGSVINVMNNNTTYAMNVYLQSGLTLTETSIFDAQADTRPVIMFHATDPERGIPLKGHDIKVEVRQTSAIAAGARIRATAYVEKLEAL